MRIYPSIYDTGRLGAYWMGEYGNRNMQSLESTDDGGTMLEFLERQYISYGTFQWIGISSGVGVQDSAVEAFQDLKLKKKYRFIIYKINDNNTEIVVEKTVEDADYDTFVASLPADQCRYCVYDFQYDTAGEGIRNKILFYVWSPDTSKIKQKMLYAASKDALRKKLDGIYTEIQCTDLSEVSHETVLDKVTRMTS